VEYPVIVNFSDMCFEETTHSLANLSLMLWNLRGSSKQNFLAHPVRNAGCK